MNQLSEEDARLYANLRPKSLSIKPTMRICKITNIKPDGKPWESQYGLMHPFYIVLEDGGAGTANSKTETPAYKVGDTVGYDVTGHSPKGVPKLKITRNPKPGEGTVWVPDTHPDLEAAKPAPQYTPTRTDPVGYTKTFVPRQNAPTSTETPVNGQTVGMAVKAAVDIHLKIRGSGAWGADDAVTIEAIARDIVGISERIQSGEEPQPF